MTVKNAGMIGLGAMGHPMAMHMVKKGFAVSGYDVSEDANARAKEVGINVVGSPADVGADAEIVVVMVATDKQVIDVVLNSGLADRLKKGSVICVASSCSPKTAQELETACNAKGLGLLLALRDKRRSGDGSST